MCSVYQNVHFFIRSKTDILNVIAIGLLFAQVQKFRETTLKIPINLSTKCQTLHLGRGNMGISYNISNVDLPNVRVVKDLGITIDSRLDYSDHINAIVTKAHQRACLILRCLKSKEPSLLFRAFSTYVRPLLEYDSPVWSPGYAHLINLSLIHI